jgi:hypothetical protein
MSVEPTIPPQQPLLEDFRPVCYAVAGEGDGSEAPGGVGYECAFGGRALSS